MVKSVYVAGILLDSFLILPAGVCVGTVTVRNMKQW